LSPGYSVNSLYVGAVLLTLFAEDPSAAYRTAAGSTLAILVGTAAVALPSPAGPVLFSRGVTALTIWGAAWVVARSRRDDVNRRGAERALVRSRREIEDVKHALDQAAIVATTNVRGDITYINDKFCEISQYSREELLGSNHRILNSGLHPPEFFREMYRTIGQGRVWRGEIRNRAKDGSFYWVDTTIVPFVDAARRPHQYIAIRYDITERKRSEAALREQTTLARIGQMAAVVAHEVRNPLAGMRSALQVVGRRVAPGGSEAAVLGEVIARIDGLNEIVSDLLLFGRPKPPALRDTTLAALVDGQVALLKRDPQFAPIHLHVDVPPDRVRVDPEQVGQALVNLLINAAQAMQGHGDIRVVGRRVDGWHEVRIVDQGPGIPPDVRPRLFEPFFTTKSRGTGLGLATARQILEGHGGSIDVECPPGGGAVFTVRLPAG